MKILVLNLGSTSTKVALFEDNTELTRKSYPHSREELAAFKEYIDQLDYRTQFVEQFLKENDCPVQSLDCIISRGGAPPNVQSGATKVNDRLVDALSCRTKDSHPAALGPIIGAKIAQPYGLPVYIYDPISSDELIPEARVFGVKGIEHDSMGHVLNTHAMGIKAAQTLGRKFEETTQIIVHIGGGNTVALWKNGHLIDIFSSDMGTFSVERCGFLRSEEVVRYCRELGPDEVFSWMHGKGGIVSLLGTNDLREVEKMIEGGDEYALQVEKAWVYQYSRQIGAFIAAMQGQIDAIVMTGGGAFWDRLAGDLEAHMSYSGIPFLRQPGELEIQALADGAVRVMRGEEEAHEYFG